MSAAGGPDNNFIYGVLKAIAEWRESEGRNLADGGASDWPDYQRRVGRIAATYEFEDLVRNQLEKWQKHLD